MALCLLSSGNFLLTEIARYKPGAVSGYGTYMNEEM
jgi:hypothetical protein